MGIVTLRYGEQCRDDSAQYGEQCVQIPRASSESRPCESGDTDENVGDIDQSKG